ncbi:unnamed protein product [Oppiella nova]|uniref:PDZ domain-containing protein n=1 Tax=Oppiella nova TaxID=334625 RepID=A0A7R9QYM5_9ACAR|nr:unnamed protein product [Oppiella nova]CAG2179203.1 unnamed protein product [Oppiella nova]
MAQRRLKKLSTPSMANTTTAAVANDNHHMTAAPDMTTNGIKCVELMRTARGFGFTLSGEMPSILTHVKGVAHQSGLRSGDYLMTVHDMDVLNITHDRIVELIQRTAGSLRLRCLASDGNYLSSNTSDEGEEDADYRHVADTDDNHRIHGSHRKSRPPSAASQTLSSSAHRHHRHHRPDSTGGRRHHRTAAKVYNDLADNALTAGRSRGLPALDRLVLPSPHVHHMGGHRLPVHHRAFKSNEPLIDLLLEQKLSQIQCNISESDSNNSYKSNSLTKSYNYNNSNNNNSNKCKTLLSRKSSAISDETQTMGADGSVGAAPPMRRTTSETNVGSISRALNI